MATRIRGSEPINGAVVALTSLSGASNGNKGSYTVPAGKQSKLVFAGFGNFVSGTPVVNILLSVGGTLITVATGTTTQSFLGQPLLNAGDQVVINVSTLAAGSSFDALICAEEYQLS